MNWLRNCSETQRLLSCESRWELQRRILSGEVFCKFQFCDKTAVKSETAVDH